MWTASESSQRLRLYRPPSRLPAGKALPAGKGHRRRLRKCQANGLSRHRSRLRKHQASIPAGEGLPAGEGRRSRLRKCQANGLSRHCSRLRKRQASGLSRLPAGEGLTTGEGLCSRLRKRQANGLSHHHAGKGFRCRLRKHQASGLSHLPAGEGLRSRLRKRQANGLSHLPAGEGLRSRLRKRQVNGLSRHHAGEGLRAPQLRKCPWAVYWTGWHSGAPQTVSGRGHYATNLREWPQSSQRPRLHRPPPCLLAGEGLPQPRAPRPRKASSHAGEGFSQFHPTRASSPAGEGFSQLHPARANSPAGEGLSRTHTSWHFTRLSGPLGHTCADGRWMCLKDTPTVQTLWLAYRACDRRFKPSLRKRSRLWTGLGFSWRSRYSFGRTTRMAARSTWALWCATSRPLCKIVRLKRPSTKRSPPSRKLEKWTQRGSGWVVDQVETLWLDIAKYQPLWDGCFLPLPPALRAKKAVVKEKNKGNHCFRWAIRAAKFPAARNPQRPSNYPQQDDLDFTGIDAPTPISQIPRFERQNDMAINVFGWDKGLTVHQISKQPEDIPRINLLLIEKDGKFHYAWIKDLNRLLYDSSKHKERKHFCERCLHGYRREDQLDAHKPECRGIGQTTVRVDMPKEDENKLAFKNYHKQLLAPYIIYADFEALTAKVKGPKPDTQRATLRGCSTTRPVDTATSLFGVMAVQSRRSNIAAPMRRGTSWNHCRKKSTKSRPC